ncbi:MAG: PEP-CTERM sorting domain-containing protein [Candidatus Thiodiazotropha sp. (ex Dulcina madagascariensis)]|nr:PEP-CTERM sorting domain-containing protein [Candidatus Thiodiazotropha sp. (ex Epidulcina cf. delphinae)]MCU7924679.1 PEP-CTERM sorting domain-containing protein [Candidatus Thiodiazotropha sp. (ex Dulcina madagascariensis)]MCU7928516.1 PEP-CTERM sorting domain-containing protein [Candidatus Thiodiazotropha sp. (ex Dulcina madagascariensis)]
MIGKKQLIMSAGLLLGFIAPPLNATLIGASGPLSSLGTAASIIAAPANILDDDIINTGMQGFDEAQGVTTSIDYAMDGGATLFAGSTVNSHMIFLNSDGRTDITHFGVMWRFDSVILGIMSDRNGNFEATSTGELGNPGTNYTTTFPGSGPAAPFGARGLEGGGDGYSIFDPFTLMVSMHVTEPGDWIRVITQANSIPEPSGLVLMGLALTALGFAVRKKKKTAIRV